MQLLGGRLHALHQTRLAHCFAGNNALRSMNDTNVPQLAQCGSCGASVPAGHRHLFDSRHAGVICACRICSLLFHEGIAATKRYRVIPEKCLRIDGLGFDAMTWRTLEIPVQAAYFVYSSVSGKITAYYPSPHGSVESLIKMDAWRNLERANPVLMRLIPDVQALLVGGAGLASESWIVGINVCYRLVATVRSCWLQPDAKNAMQQSLGRFFESLRAEI
jgi:hypothetical protein